MYKFLYLTFFSLYLVMSLEAVVVQNYNGYYDPYTGNPSNARPQANYSPDDPRNPYNRSALYFNYNPFPDSNRHEEIFERNRK